MNLEFVQMMFDYNYWAHRLVWGCVMSIDNAKFTEPIDYSWGSVHAQVVHTMSAEWIWLNRLRGDSPGAMFDLADYPDRAAVRGKWDQIEADFRSYLSGLTPEALGGAFTYTTTSGRRYTQPIAPVLMHVVNHGTDHRAQILAMLSQIGGDTVEQDMVFYLRELTESGS